MPLGRPGEDDDPRATETEGDPDLPRQDRRLLLLAVSKAVESDLTEQHRAVIAEAVQSREVVLEGPWGFQVHVEGHEVEERELQVFRRRVVHVGHEGVGILLLRDAIEPLDEPLDPPPSVPTHDRCRDLVSDAVAEHGGMVGTNPDPSPDAAFNFFDLAGLIQEGHVLTPVEPHHDPKPVLQGDVEEPARRTRVDPNDVEAVRGHLGEVSFHRLGREPLLADLIDEERVSPTIMVARSDTDTPRPVTKWNSCPETPDPPSRLAMNAFRIPEIVSSI